MYHQALVSVGQKKGGGSYWSTLLLFASTSKMFVCWNKNRKGPIKEVTVKIYSIQNWTLCKKILDIWFKTKKNECTDHAGTTLQPSAWYCASPPRAARTALNHRGVDSARPLKVPCGIRHQDFFRIRSFKSCKLQGTTSMVQTCFSSTSHYRLLFFFPPSTCWQARFPSRTLTTASYSLPFTVHPAAVGKRKRD